MRISGTKNTPGGRTICQQGWRARPTPWAHPLSCGSHMGPLHLFQHPSTPSSLRKNHSIAQTRVLAHFPAIFDLLAQSSIHKTALGDCSSVCDSSNGPISFCSSALFIANFCCCEDHVLELACQIYMVQRSFDARYSLKALIGVVSINFVEFGSLLC